MPFHCRSNRGEMLLTQTCTRRTRLGRLSIMSYFGITQKRETRTSNRPDGSPSWLQSATPPGGWGSFLEHEPVGTTWTSEGPIPLPLASVMVRHQNPCPCAPGGWASSIMRIPGPRKRGVAYLQQTWRFSIDIDRALFYRILKQGTLLTMTACKKKHRRTPTY